MLFRSLHDKRTSTSMCQKDNWKSQNDIVNQQNQCCNYLMLTFLWNNDAENSTKEEDNSKEHKLEKLKGSLE